MATYIEDFQQDQIGEFYVDEVADQPGVYGVFGSESGRCYGTWFDKESAQANADGMNSAREGVQDAGR